MEGGREAGMTRVGEGARETRGCNKSRNIGVPDECAVSHAAFRPRLFSPRNKTRVEFKISFRDCGICLDLRSNLYYVNFGFDFCRNMHRAENRCGASPNFEGSVGLKYLHSARILHRDIKPGNLLVNSNCVLKICDFGLARVEEPDQNKHMTQEVVTQYYRAPEILMGARHYTAAVDVWSVGCIFGELLRRRILFQAQSPVQQLELITELLGTPTLEDMRFACEGARSHMLRRAPKPPSLTALYTLSSQATHEAVHLLCQMLVFDPLQQLSKLPFITIMTIVINSFIALLPSDKRITVVDALAHPYLDEGRLRYHSCMCTCCYTTSGGLRQYTGDFEPATSHPFDDLWERKLTTVQQVKEEMHKFIAEQLNTSRVPLCINPQSAAFKSFARDRLELWSNNTVISKAVNIEILFMDKIYIRRRRDDVKIFSRQDSLGIARIPIEQRDDDDDDDDDDGGLNFNSNKSTHCRRITWQAPSELGALGGLEKKELKGDRKGRHRGLDCEKSSSPMKNGRLRFARYRPEIEESFETWKFLGFGICQLEKHCVSCNVTIDSINGVIELQMAVLMAMSIHIRTYLVTDEIYDTRIGEQTSRHWSHSTGITPAKNSFDKKSKNLKSLCSSLQEHENDVMRRSHYGVTKITNTKIQICNIYLYFEHSDTKNEIHDLSINILLSLARTTATRCGVDLKDQ
ncbi:Serine/threonine-protein kinase NLK [Melipona quadrifasciata]|uniref:Serine/threonine-protein kinase NLK n=2 Tax=Apocrita TaxID=7400 RepID=A0A0N0BC50_9HYME|nr:Serine/threonine-protein kinase NLK [Melipona quadrifasciata]